MIIKRKASASIVKEPAHGGTGFRKVLVDTENSQSAYMEMMTHGFLTAGSTFDWHHHDGVEEVMYVLTGSGTVSDEEGDYLYAPGDVFVFPPNIEHKISNPTSEDHEMVFLRIKA